MPHVAELVEAKHLPASTCTHMQRGADSEWLSPFFTSSAGKPDPLTPGRDGGITSPEPGAAVPAEHTALRFGLVLAAPGVIGLIRKVLISSLQEPAAAGISHPELISVPITPLSDTDAAAEMPTGSAGLGISAGNSTGRENPALSLGEHQLLF